MPFRARPSGVRRRPRRPRPPFGEAGVDVLFGDGWLFDQARGGDDWLDGGDGNDRMRGDDDILTDYTRAGADHLEGGAGDDLIYGDGERASLRARLGDDVLVGGAGNDTLFGDSVRSSAG